MATVPALLAVARVWANGIIRDTDRYGATVGPPAADPDVQQAVAARAAKVTFVLREFLEAAPA